MAELQEDPLLEEPTEESKADESKGDESKADSKEPKKAKAKKMTKKSQKPKDEKIAQEKELEQVEPAKPAPEVSVNMDPAAEEKNSKTPAEKEVPETETSKEESRKKAETQEEMRIEKSIIGFLKDISMHERGAYAELKAEKRAMQMASDESQLSHFEHELKHSVRAAVLLIKGGNDPFFYRILASFPWEALQKAFCLLFQCDVKMTLQRISEFLIFLLPEARSRSEEDVEQGEHLTQMHGKVQQTAVVLVESLRDYDQEMLWFSMDGLTILMQMHLSDARLFFARPKLQSIMIDLWRGARPDLYSRSFGKTVYVWTRVLCFALPNLMALPFWALFPILEEKAQKRMIQAANAARRSVEGKPEEENQEHSQTESEAGTDIQPRNDDLPGMMLMFNDYSVREQSRYKLFEVQSRMPLLLPCNKKYLAVLTNFIFMGYLIQERPDSAAVVSVLLLSAGAWLGEVGQLLAFVGTSGGGYSLSFWFMDRVNVMELVAFTCIASTSVLCLIQPELTELAQQFKALGVLFLGISQSMALLRMSSVFGPLIAMTLSMLVDLLQWSTLLFPIVASLVAALMTLFKTRSDVKQDNCLPFGFDYVQGVLRFFEIQIGEDVPLDCLRDSSPHPWFGQIIMNLGLWMILILMLNMLIAMMAKTFDRIYEGAMVDFQYHFIGNLLQIVSEPAVPPVLRTLSLPYLFCKAVHYGFVRYRHGSQENGSSDGSEKMGSTRKTTGPVKLRRSAVEDSLKARQSWADQADDEKEAKLAREQFRLLNDLVEKFVEEHASDTQVQDELWRKQIARQLFENDARQEKMAQQITHLIKELEKLNESPDKRNLSSP